MGFGDHFEPKRLDKSFGPMPVRREEHLEFTVGVYSDSDLPELTLWMNPKSFSLSYEHMNSPRRTRQGWAIEHAGLRMDQMSVSGRSAGCFVDFVGVATACDQQYVQQSSLARQTIDLLTLLYEDNGAIRNQSVPAVIDLIGFAYVAYDGHLYTGYFDSFETSEVAESPYAVDFSFVFIVYWTTKE